MKRSTKLLAAGAAVFLVAFALWYPVVEPMLVRFPSSVNDTMQYKGTLTFFVDMQTGAALPTPDVQPLEVTRTLKSVPGETGAHRATLQEVLTLTASGLDQWQASRYVLDRRSMKNVKDARANAWGAPVDRSGAYFPIAPMGVEKGKTYNMWFGEAGTVYPLAVPANAKTEKVNGVDVLRGKASLPNLPVSSQFQDTVLKLAGAPTSLTYDQFKAQARARGIDLDQVQGALAKVLSPSEVSVLLATLQKPLPLRYFAFLKEAEAVLEPKTGLVMDLALDDKGVSVAPDFTPWAPMQQILAAHAGDPTIKAVTDGVASMATAPPQPVYELRFSQTPASVAKMADKARDQVRQLDLAHRWIPGALGVLTVLLLGATIISFRRRPTPVTALPVPAPIEEAPPKAA